MAKKAGRPKKITTLGVKVSQELLDRYKEYCASKEITLSSAIRTHMSEKVQEFNEYQLRMAERTRDLQREP